jgi:hypothetical protein
VQGRVWRKVRWNGVFNGDLHLLVDDGDFFEYEEGAYATRAKMLP